MFVLSPYLEDVVGRGADVEWKYYSFEVDRVEKEFKFAAFFMEHDYDISHYENGGMMNPITAEYLLGRVQDSSGNPILVSPTHLEVLQKVYANRIVPMFGEYTDRGERLKKGCIDFIEERTNPTGIRKHLMDYAEQEGEFTYETFQAKNPVGDLIQHKKVVGYVPRNPNKFTIVITDHLRKLVREQKFSQKENIDKLIEYQVELRNRCGFTFVDIIHLNRDLADVQRVRLNPEFLYPTGDDVKDTGNLSEEANKMFTMFDPNDPKYNISKHFGMPLLDSSQSLIHPNYKSLHLVEAREVPTQNFRLNMFGNTGRLEELNYEINRSSGYGYGG